LRTCISNDEEQSAVTSRHGANRAQRPNEAAAGETPRDSAEAEAAASVVQQAREALHRAEDAYRQSLEHVSQQASRARGVTVGDIIDGTLEFVRRHPATGLLAVGVVGFLLGRSTRR
jgi:ElaB/YqjD/DUF883 family membrane-anchored ribosome-binding protein